MPPATSATVTLPALQRINGVEILHIGERIPASTGPVTVTHDDLAAIVAASRDPNAPAAVLKIGHTDARFDGQPAYGRLTNFRLSAEGSAVVVDLVGVPARLAHLIPYAWPSRSIEMLRQEHAAKIGLGQYRRVCTAVSLLGIALPAITRLEDIYTVTGLQEVPPMTKSTPDVAALSGGLTMEDIAGKVRRKLEAAKAFLHDLVVEDAGLAAIFETPDYALHQVPVTVNGTEVTLGESKQVYRTYATMDRLGAAPISVGGLDTMTAANTQDLAQEVQDLKSAVTTLTAAILDRLEANTATVEDATDATGQEATTDPVEDPATDDPGQPDDATQDDTKDQAPATGAEDMPAAQQEYEALVKALEDSRKQNEALAAANRVLQQENARYSEAQAKQMSEQRDAVLMSAIRDGRITPAQRPGYEAWAAVDPTGCADHLASLQPTNPTKEMGYAADVDGAPSADDLLARSPWAKTSK